MDEGAEPSDLIERLGLTDYEATALEHLLTLGRTTAPNLAESTGIPKARIYGVLEELADRGFIKVIPGRPKHYQPKPPAEIVDRAVEHARQRYESRTHELAELRDPFLAAFQTRFDQASEEVTPTEELFWVVDVGTPSESETRALYREATAEVNVLTKSFEYFESVEPDLVDALDRDVSVAVLFVHPRHLSAENRSIQRDIVARLESTYPAIDCRFSEVKLPWRGTLADPSLDYESGRAILLVEEPEIPLSMRQAAVTDNASFVAGLKRYFDLTWTNESVAVSAVLE